MNKSVGNNGRGNTGVGNKATRVEGTRENVTNIQWKSRQAGWNEKERRT
jgi:hypothetical protein